jgi:hypothetical protein
MPRSVMLLWAAVATVVLVIAGILAFLALSQQGAIDPPSNEQSPTQEQGPEAVLDTSYTVLVLNGTAAEGLAEQVGDQLREAGFADELVNTSDSDVTDFADTTVFYVDVEDEAAARGLADAIGGAAVEQSTTYQSSDPEAKELTVVVGLDRAPAA